MPPRRTPVESLSPWDQYVRKWASSGCGAEECHKATHIVLARGTVPCDVLFIGEAPGKSENSQGVPFWGPAGCLLDGWINIARRVVPVIPSRNSVTTDVEWTHAFTNLVGCIPLDEDGRKATEPYPEQIKQCRPRLEEFVELARPRLLVLVGRMAEDWANDLRTDIPRTAIQHPAAVLRASEAHKGLLSQRAIVTLQNAIADIK